MRPAKQILVGKHIHSLTGKEIRQCHFGFLIAVCFLLLYNSLEDEKPIFVFFSIFRKIMLKIYENAL